MATRITAKTGQTCWCPGRRGSGSSCSCPVLSRVLPGGRASLFGGILLRSRSLWHGRRRLTTHTTPCVCHLATRTSADTASPRRLGQLKPWFSCAAGHLCSLLPLRARKHRRPHSPLPLCFRTIALGRNRTYTGASGAGRECHEQHGDRFRRPTHATELLPDQCQPHGRQFQLTPSTSATCQGGSERAL